MFVCVAMHAQFGDMSEFKNEVYAEYTPYKLHTEGYGTTSYNVTSFALGYNRYFGIACDGNLKLVAGGKLTYGSKNDYKHFNVRIPVSIMYSIPVSESFAIEPYAGINATIGIVTDEDYRSWLGKDYIGYYYKDVNDINAGWHAGVDFAINHFVVGGAYQHDFTKLYDHVGRCGKWSDFEIKVGYRF